MSLIDILFPKFDWNGFILSLISIMVSILFAYKIQHKKILYSVAKKGDEYLVVFWNALGKTIYEEDLYTLFLYGNLNCKCEEKYPKDEIPLKINIGSHELIGTRQMRRIHLAFDFLYRKKGYIIYIDNQQKEGYLPGKFGLYGRLRGENKKAVRFYKKLYKKAPEIEAFKETIGWIVASILAGAFLSYCIYASISCFIQANHILVGLLLFLFSCLGLATIVYFNYLTMMPHKLKKKFKEYLKDGYKEIVNKNSLCTEYIEGRKIKVHAAITKVKTINKNQFKS